VSVLRHAAALLLLASACLAASSARAQTLVADISSHLIAVTTGFAGAELVLFGATDRPGDVVIAVSGPPIRAIVRRKVNLLGIWANGPGFNFVDVPSFYSLASTKPLDQITKPETLQRYGIGTAHLPFGPEETGAPRRRPEIEAAYREAVIRAKQRAALYTENETAVTFVGNTLFRTNVAFPSNVPIGEYRIEVFLFRNGQLVSTQVTPLQVSRVGFSAGIFDFANRSAVLYAIVALALAMSLGWIINLIFRRT
jgi:uncharacterized protein (TIGR02186 family)